MAALVNNAANVDSFHHISLGFPTLRTSIEKSKTVMMKTVTNMVFCDPNEVYLLYFGMFYLCDERKNVGHLLLRAPRPESC